MKDIFKKIILENQELKLSITARDFVFPETSKIVSLIGMRRVGKSYILFSKIDALRTAGEKEKIIYINFDDERLSGIKVSNLDEIMTAYYELYPDNIEQKLFLFFDEIQNVDSWALFVKRLYETKKFDISITGSSAKLLSKELATELRGRTLPFYIYPLSFLEFLRFKGFMFDKNIFYSNKLMKLKEYFREYMEWGGFPELIKEELKIETLNSYLDLTIYKDLIERYNIKNYRLIKSLIKHLLSYYSKEFSVNSYYKIIKQEQSVSRETISDYVSYLEDVNFVYFVKRFDYSLKNQELSLKKWYISDLWFLKLWFSFSSNNGQKLENLVCIELKRRGLDIYYHRNKKECDFIIRQWWVTTEAIQVSYSLADPETKKREIEGLLEAMDVYNLTTGIILTVDEDEEITIAGKNIQVLPVWKWLVS